MKATLQELTRDNFPEELREIPDAPTSLYYIGSLPNWSTKRLAVVGSRVYTEYGKEICEHLIKDLAGYDISIVSGLALGIDGIAHEAALGAGLHTIAIPGSGLHADVLYPRTHRNLARRIIQSGGLLLSEFEPHQKALPHLFPKRNRIVAGLSHATLVIEAKPRSGTLITARLAMEYNRDVLTVPGHIESSHRKGPHSLLKEGAALIENAHDIIKALDLIPDPTNTAQLPTLSHEEEIVLYALRKPLTKKDLSNHIHLPTSVIDITLSSLHLKGLITYKLGKIERIR